MVLGVLILFVSVQELPILFCVDPLSINAHGTTQAMHPTKEERLSSSVINHDVRDAYNDQSTRKRKLPSNKVFLTGPRVPETLIKGNLDENLDLVFHFFNNSAVARSVMLIDRQLKEETNVTGAWESWKAMRPWSFRADLWRYMVIWSEGGIYIDSKIKLIAPVSLWAGLSQDESVAVCSDNGITYESPTLGRNVDFLQIGMFSGKKGSPVLLEAIKLIIRNVERRSYGIPGDEAVLDRTGHMDLSVTGPILFGYAAARIEHGNGQNNTSNSQVRMECIREGDLSLFGEIPVADIDTYEHSKVREGGNKYGGKFAECVCSIHTNWLFSHLSSWPLSIA